MLFRPANLPASKTLAIKIDPRLIGLCLMVMALLVIAAPQGHALAATMPGVHTPQVAQSFDIDTSSFLTTAASIFNALWPAFAIIVGITLGLGLLGLIVRELRQAI